MSIVKTTNSTHEKKSVNKSAIFDPFAGGRFLMAVAENPHLTSEETLVLLILGSIQDFNDFMHSKRYITQKRLKELSKLSIRKIRDCIRDLEAKGYLITEERYAPNGARLANSHALADLIFTEIEDIWKAKNHDEEDTPPRHSVPVPPAQDAGTPRHSVPPKIPNMEIPNKNKKGKSKDLPKKGITQNKKWELRQCQDMGIDVFTPDADQQGRIPNPGRRAIELHMSEMHQKYGYQAVKLFIDDLKDQGLRGKALFNRSKIDNAVRAAFEFLQQKNTEVVSEPSQRIQDQPIPF
jgi:hypothetical protein